MSKKKFWSTDKIVSFSAILISVLTLIVFIYQTGLMRQQQQLSVMPYLSVSQASTGTPYFKVLLENDGIGPAFIESRTIVYQDSIYDMDLPDFMKKYIPAYKALDSFYYSNINPGRMIPQGETIYLFQIDNSLKNAIFLDSLLDTLALDWQITYSSIYNQKWQITSDQPVPRKVR